MKNILLLLALAVTFASCEGDQGPPGFDGLNGEDGVNIVAQSFETTVDFEAPDYSVLVPYPDNIETFEGDMTLIYILFDQVEGNNGGLVDVFRLLPQTLYTDFGEFQYNFDFTNGDANIFLDAPNDFNFDNLVAADTDNQTFRIVILPAELASDPRLDVTDYQSVMDLADLDQQDIINIEF
jgi:hypothetical protein